MGRTPPEAMLKNGLISVGILMESTLMLCKTLPKVFLFHFTNPSQEDMVFNNRPWSMHSSLVVFQKWSQDFIVYDRKKLRVPVWVKFPGLPLPCWPFIESIANTLGKVITKEHEFFLMFLSDKFAKGIVNRLNKRPTWQG